MGSMFHGQKTICHTHCEDLLSEYVAFIRDCRGSAPSTINIRQQYVSAFLLTGLNHLCTATELTDLHPSAIHEHVIARGKSLSRAGRKQLVSSLRSFLRFLYIRGYIKRDLISAVPVIPLAKLDRHPEPAPGGFTHLLQIPRCGRPLAWRPVSASDSHSAQAATTGST